MSAARTAALEARLGDLEARLDTAVRELLAVQDRLQAVERREAARVAAALPPPPIAPPQRAKP